MEEQIKAVRERLYDGPVYPTGYLKNTLTGRYHPIPFRPAPTPSDAAVAGGAQRHRSIGHHTLGFDTLELAQADVASRPQYRDCGTVWEWDGVEVPVITQWFA